MLVTKGVLNTSRGKHRLFQPLRSPHVVHNQYRAVNTAVSKASRAALPRASRCRVLRLFLPPTKSLKRSWLESHPSAYTTCASQ